MRKIYLYLLVSVSALLISGCDYLPMEEFIIKTEDGKLVTFVCPVLDVNRSGLTYVYDGRCFIKKAIQ